MTFSTAPRSIDWPYVGRDDETELVTANLLGARTGGTAITGPRGVGKSRLAAEAVRRATARRDAAGEPTVVLRAVGAAALEPVPFGSLVHLLAGLAEVGQDDPPTAVARKLVAGLADRVGEGVAVLVLDDADHLDPASLALVQQLVVDGRVRLVATVRSTDGRLPPVLAALCQDGALAHLHLRPLPPEAEKYLLAGALSGDVDPLTEANLHEASQGNPLLLANLVYDGLDSGALAIREGVWTWRGPIAAGRHLQAVIGARLERLGASEREALEYVALGSGLPLSVLTDLCAGEAVDGLVTGRLVEVADGEERLVRAAHPLYGDLMLDLVPPARRRSRCAALVDAYRARFPDTLAGVVRMAAWSLEGDVDLHPEPLLMAARFANTGHDYALAIRLARAAWAAGGGPGAGLELAYAQRWSGAPTDALATLEELEGTLDGARVGSGDEEGERHLAGLALLRSQVLAYSLGDAPAAEAALVDAAARTHGRVRERVLTERRIQRLWVGRFTEEGEAAAVQLADPATPVETRLRLAPLVALYWSYAGRSDDAQALADRYIPEALAGVDRYRWAAEELLYTKHIAETYSGVMSLADLPRLLGAAREQDVPLRPDALVVQMGLGRVRLLQGRVDEAVTLLRGAVSGMRDQDPSGFLRYALVTLAHATALQGDPVAATGYVAEADHLPSRLSAVIGPELRWSLAWAGWAADGIPRTVDRLREVAEWSAGHRYSGTELWARHDLLRLGQRGEAKAVDDLARQVQGRWAVAFGLHAQGLSASDGGVLQKAADQFEAIDADLYGAEAAAEAARIHAALGERRAAAAARRQALRLATRCAGARTPGLSSLPLPASLTQREREVAERAARGLPNRQIADSLSVSVRTVEGHLARTYAKVGVSNRVDLARALGFPEPATTVPPVSWRSPPQRGGRPPGGDGAPGRETVPH